MRLTLAAFMLLPSAAWAEPATIASIVDGDTVCVTMSVEPMPPAGKPAYVRCLDGSLKVRVEGLDTPEKTQPAPGESLMGWHARCAAEAVLGQQATAFAVERMPVGKPVDVVVIEKGEKWGRVLARLYVDGREWAAIVIEAGLGVPYFGRTKTSWCPPLD